jgi:hypothetical protein
MNSPAPAAVRLWLARALAWALLLSGWLVLGALGRQYLPGWAAGQWAPALWLAVIGLLLAGVARRPPALRTLRFVLPVAGGAAALALAAAGRGGGAGAIAAAAVAWAGLLVAASLGVRALRQVQPRRPAAPLLPALLGALAAWLLAGDVVALPGRADRVAGALAGAALLLAALLPARAVLKQGCRSGLFDCSLPLLTARGWRDTARWPLQAAALAMLPMMATLPLLAEWCAGPGRSPAAMVLLHLAAMVLPALGAQAWLRRAGPLQQAGVVGALLVAGALAPAAWPGVDGLMSGALLQAAAWSLAWAGPMLAPHGGTVPDARPHHAAAWPAAGMALLVLAVGTAVAVHGPVALAAVHALLGTVVAAGLLLAALRRSAAAAFQVRAPAHSDRRVHRTR